MLYGKSCTSSLCSITWSYMINIFFLLQLSSKVAVLCLLSIAALSARRKHGKLEKRNKKTSTEAASRLVKPILFEKTYQKKLFHMFFLQLLQHFQNNYFSVFPWREFLVMLYYLVSTLLGNVKKGLEIHISEIKFTFLTA